MSDFFQRLWEARVMSYKNITCEKKIALFIELTEIIKNKTYVNRLCVSIFFLDMGWYLVIIGDLRNN